MGVSAFLWEVKAAKTPMNEIIEMNQMLNDWAIQPTKPRTLLEILLKIGQKTRRHPFNVLDKSEKGTAGFLDPVVGGIMGNMLLLSNWFLNRKMGVGFTFTEQHFNTPLVRLEMTVAKGYLARSSPLAQSPKLSNPQGLYRGVALFY